jgi:hypothetical protein
LSPKRIAHHVENGTLVGTYVHTPISVWTRAEAADLVRHLPKGGAQVTIAEAEHRIEMHGRATLRHQAGNDARGHLVPEQLCRDLKHRLPRRPLAHADQDDAFSDGHHVAALERGGTSEVSQSPTRTLKSASTNRGGTVWRAESAFRVYVRASIGCGGHAVVNQDDGSR